MQNEITPKHPVVVYGAGGLARETAWLVRRLRDHNISMEFKGFIVTDLAKLTDRDSAELVLGNETWLDDRPDAMVALGIGTPKTRCSIGRRLVEKYGPKRLPHLIDPSAIFDVMSNRFDAGAIVTAGCILTMNVIVKRFAFINLGCTIGHETVIGEGCVLNPSVNISGGVTLGDGVLVGTGAQILQYIKVGDGAIVGAGAVVTRDVAPGETVIGVPAKPRVANP